MSWVVSQILQKGGRREQTSQNELSSDLHRHTHVTSFPTHAPPHTYTHSLLHTPTTTRTYTYTCAPNTHTHTHTPACFLPLLWSRKHTVIKQGNSVPITSVCLYTNGTNSKKEKKTLHYTVKDIIPPNGLLENLFLESCGFQMCRHMWPITQCMLS